MRKWLFLLLIFLFVSTAYSATVAWYSKTLDTSPSGTDTVMTWDGSATQTATLTSILALGGTVSPLTNKGDIYTYDTDNQRLAVGTNGYVLTADSTKATGLTWSAAGGGSGDMLASTYDPATVSEQLLGLTATQTVSGKSLSGSTNTFSNIPISTLSITGTPNGAKYLRDDDTWVTPPGSSPLTTKGDINVFSTVDDRLAVGTNGYLLGADSTQATGLKYYDQIAVDFILEDAAPTIANQLTYDASNDALRVYDGASVDSFSNDAGTAVLTNKEMAAGSNIFSGFPYELCVAASDEATDLTAGTAKVTFRTPRSFTLTEVRASVNTAPTGATLIVDINEAGATVLSTKITIDVSEKSSETAAIPPVISDSAIADDAEITIDIDQIGSTIAGKGAKVCLLGTISI